MKTKPLLLFALLPLLATGQSGKNFTNLLDP